MLENVCSKTSLLDLALHVDWLASKTFGQISVMIVWNPSRCQKHSRFENGTYPAMLYLTSIISSIFIYCLMKRTSCITTIRTTYSLQKVILYSLTENIYDLHLSRGEKCVPWTTTNVLYTSPSLKFPITALLTVVLFVVFVQEATTIMRADCLKCTQAQLK